MSPLDFLGIILFIIFMIVSATRDRKKGMSKAKPARREPMAPQTVRAEPVHPEPVQRKRKTAPAQDKREERRAFEQVRQGPFAAPVGEPVMSKPYLPEEESVFDMESPMEESSIDELSPVYAMGHLSGGPGIQELRRAVVWSEILQKPRALRKRIR